MAKTKEEKAKEATAKLVQNLSKNDLFDISDLKEEVSKMGDNEKKYDELLKKAYKITEEEIYNDFMNNYTDEELDKEINASKYMAIPKMKPKIESAEQVSTEELDKSLNTADYNYKRELVRTDKPGYKRDEHDWKDYMKLSHIKRVALARKTLKDEGYIMDSKNIDKLLDSWGRDNDTTLRPEGMEKEIRSSENKGNINAEDVYEHTTMRIDNIIGKGKIFQDLTKEEQEEATKKLLLRAERITHTDKMEVFIKILKERGFTKLAKEVNNMGIKASEEKQYKFKEEINSMLELDTIAETVIDSISAYAVKNFEMPEDIANEIEDKKNEIATKLINDIKELFKNNEKYNKRLSSTKGNTSLDTAYMIMEHRAGHEIKVFVPKSEHYIQEMANKGLFMDYQKVISSDWGEEDHESKFYEGNMVKITGDELYKDKVGVVSEVDTAPDEFDPMSGNAMFIYHIEGDGIDPEASESWVSEYHLENADKIKSADNSQELESLRYEAKQLERILKKDNNWADNQRLERIYDKINKLKSADTIKSADKLKNIKGEIKMINQDEKIEMALRKGKSEAETLKIVADEVRRSWQAGARSGMAEVMVNEIFGGDYKAAFEELVQQMSDDEFFSGYEFIKRMNYNGDEEKDTLAEAEKEFLS